MRELQQLIVNYNFDELSRIEREDYGNGGFTTYATFSYETTAYFQEGAWTLGAINVLATTVGCLAACAAGLLWARWAF